MAQEFLPINREEPVLVTGAAGFIGTRVVGCLLKYGYRNIRCFVRPSSTVAQLVEMKKTSEGNIQILQGNLLSSEDCKKAVEGVRIIYHLAAGKGLKSISEGFLNSVVTTRNLLEAALATGQLLRFVNVSSFAVYSNLHMKPGALLDETCPVESQPTRKGDAYSYAKIKQDELVMEYGKKRNLPFVIVRPGVVYGPGIKGIHGRIGIDSFGPFLHLGGSNRIPLTYVNNCAEGIVLAGLIKGVDGEVFNVVDDDLPTSRQFLKMYKKNVENMTSFYVPKFVSHLFCNLWEKYSDWSSGQLPAVFNSCRWSSDWKGNRYSNEKMKMLLSWKPSVSFDEASRNFFDYCRTAGRQQ